MQEATISVTPKKFNATMELQASITQTETVDPLSGKKQRKIEEMTGKEDLISYPIPDLAFQIKHLCEVGVFLKYQIGYSTKLLGTETMVFGATSSLPDDAIIFIDLVDPPMSYHRGFEMASLEPIFDITAITASIKFAVFTQADLVFELDLAHIGKMDVELNLKIPQLATTISAGYSKRFFPSPFP